MSSMNMIQIIKKAAVEAVEASNPTRIMYGTVVNSTPAIKIDQKFTITKEFIVLTNNVKKHNVNVTIDGEQKTITIDNGLKVGDKVVMMQEQGGQRYIILDKVGG